MGQLIEVGKHKIGYGQKPFVIGEVGSNWASLDDCMTSISQAKACGADAVKFQAYNPTALYGIGRDDAVSLSLLSKGVLQIGWLPQLKEKCDAVGIEFMCSAFSPELLDAVDPFVRIHKLASSEMCHVRMLEKLRDCGKPVFMSMAGQHPSDIERALDAISDVPRVLMYCVGGYPTNRFNPRAVEDLRSRFKGELIGLSDHSREVYSTTYRQDAAVIEKHVNFVGATGPDAPHSLNAEEFKDFVAGLTALPEWTGPTKEEKDFITRHKRRLIATRNIGQGEPLVYGGNFGIYRSLKDESHAFSPWFVDEVDGMFAKTTIFAGDGIGPGDI